MWQVVSLVFLRIFVGPKLKLWFDLKFKIEKNIKKIMSYIFLSFDTFMTYINSKAIFFYCMMRLRACCCIICKRESKGQKWLELKLWLVAFVAVQNHLFIKQKKSIVFQLFRVFYFVVL